MGLKQHLTPQEKLAAAYSHLVMGVEQHAIAALFGVNQGRVNEAIQEVKAVIHWPAKKETDR